MQNIVQQHEHNIHRTYTELARVKLQPCKGPLPLKHRNCKSGTATLQAPLPPHRPNTEIAKVKLQHCKPPPLHTNTESAKVKLKYRKSPPPPKHKDCKSEIATLQGPPIYQNTEVAN